MGQDVYYNGEIAITPALTESDAAVLRAVTNLQQTEETRPFFAAVAASPEPDLPYHGGLIEISEDREFILPEEDVSRHGFRLWLKLAIEHYLAPRGMSWMAKSPGKGSIADHYWERILHSKPHPNDVQEESSDEQSQDRSASTRVPI
jgi:hypothetical protein